MPQILTLKREEEEEAKQAAATYILVLFFTDLRRWLTVIRSTWESKCSESPQAVDMCDCGVNSNKGQQFHLLFLLITLPLTSFSSPAEHTLILPDPNTTASVHFTWNRRLTVLLSEQPVPFATLLQQNSHPGWRSCLSNLNGDFQSHCCTAGRDRPQLLTTNLHKA